MIHKQTPALLLAALILASACGGDSESVPDSLDAPAVAPTAAPPPETTVPPPTSASPTTITLPSPEGFDTYEIAADGFAISVPRSWVSIDLTAEDVAAILSDVDLDPSALALVEQSLAGGLSFVAIDVTGDPNINVLAIPRGPGDSVENIERLAVAQIEQLFGGVVLGTEELEIDNRATLRIRYEAEFPAGLAEGNQYYVVSEDDVFVITFTSFDAEVDRTLFPQVMETFRLLS